MSLSAVSERRLGTCHPDIQRVVRAVAEKTPTMVVCGHRPQAEQDEAVRLGRSKTPWPRSRHNSMPSRAVDLAPLKNGAIDWNDAAAFIAFGRLVLATAAELGVTLRWGGDWDGDGKTRHDGDRDERFVDLPHFELRGS
jgi:hypothetical protein